MKPYDPKLHPNKSLEENIENLIAWIRSSNRGTASVLKNITDKLRDISSTEENLKSLENTIEGTLDQIKIVLESLSEQTGEDSNKNDSSEYQADVEKTFDSIKGQIKHLDDSIRETHEEIRSDITSSMNKLEWDILAMKSDIGTINSQLQISSHKAESVDTSERNIQQELTKIREQIICKTEQDKATILQIIDSLILHLAHEVVEISGLDLKKQLVNARTQVYEKTEGLAPRFRKMMDSLMETINDDTLYSQTTLEFMLVEGLRYIREIYHSAPVGQYDI
jgi:chromosome segregation ATPase